MTDSIKTVSWLSMLTIYREMTWKETYWRTEVCYTGSSLYSQLMKLWRGGEYNGVSRPSVVGET